MNNAMLTPHVGFAHQPITRKSAQLMLLACAALVACESTPDCNENGLPDDCDLESNDCDANGVPDECDADCDADGTPDACESDCDSDAHAHATSRRWRRRRLTHEKVKYRHIHDVKQRTTLVEGSRCAHAVTVRGVRFPLGLPPRLVRTTPRVHLYQPCRQELAVSMMTPF